MADNATALRSGPNRVYSHSEVLVMLCALYDEVLNNDSESDSQRVETFKYVEEFIRTCDEFLTEIKRAHEHD